LIRYFFENNFETKKQSVPAAFRLYTHTYIYIYTRRSRKKLRGVGRKKRDAVKRKLALLSLTLLNNRSVLMYTPNMNNKKNSVEILKKKKKYNIVIQQIKIVYILTMSY